MKVVLMAVLVVAVASTLHAEETEVFVPSRHIIRTPASGVGYLTPYQAPRYAYGWFGAQPREAHYHHYGYYRNYKQWKWK